MDSTIYIYTLRISIYILVGECDAGCIDQRAESGAGFPLIKIGNSDEEIFFREFNSRGFDFILGLLWLITSFGPFYS